MLSDSNARLVAARRLTSRGAVARPGGFLPRAPSRFAKPCAAGTVLELLRHRGGRAATLTCWSCAAGAGRADQRPGCRRAVSETVHSAGPDRGVPAAAADVRWPRCWPGYRGWWRSWWRPNDPGNAGTILRTADAAGADAVLFAGDWVDPYNGKAVRASAGSLFHLDVVTGLDPAAASPGLPGGRAAHAGHHRRRRRGPRRAARRRRAGGPTAWVFGNEARGLPAELLAGGRRRRSGCRSTAGPRA